ncbi:MAG TPA: hypothetical protein VFK13_12005 [Gemmatimonadaceae bacterium]|nr:hypothetical protein [Gemmatimonadaceae bacterium]
MSRPRPLADREVPLRRRHTPASVHAWLDGDLPEAAVRSGETARDVDFWKQIGREVDQRRHMRTPVHVYDEIMNALPQTTPQVITPWWRRPLELTPMNALILGAAILAAGLVIGAIIRG